MADDDAQFDEELLSALLDDELTSEERARVEERLSADPSARQLLDELRSVSLAMRGLPHAKLGSDLRDSVLRRAERAMLVAKDAKQAGYIEPATRRLPFGRSKRAWFWAGAAIAAGLMLMFIEREAPRNADLPKEFALNRPRAEAPEGPLPPLAMRSLEARDEAAPEATLGAPVAAVPQGDASKGDVAVAESGMAEESGQRVDSFASTFDRAGGIGGIGDGAAGRESFVEAADGSRLLVVHVSVTPEAMRNRAFEATLLKNQIEVEAEAEALADQPAQPQNLEVVVVEAAQAQVISTLADIKRDTANYVGIAVEEQAPRLQEGLAKVKQQQIESDARLYNRGRVANRQRVQLSPDNRNYTYAPQQNFSFQQRQLAGEARKAKAELSAAARSAAAPVTPPTDHPSDFAKASPAESSQSLALERDKLDAASSTEQPVAAYSAGEHLHYYGTELLSRTPQNVARRASQKLTAKADLLQVLFVLQSEDAAATAATPTIESGPTSGTAPAAPPVPAEEEGLKQAE